MQHRPVDALATMLDSWDEALPWDAVVLQELTRRGPATVSIHGVGRRRHAIVLSRAAQGMHRVAITLHHRWRAAI